MITQKEFEEAKKRQDEFAAKNPRVKKAVFLPGKKRLLVTLDNNLELSFPPAMLQGLENATARELSNIEIQGGYAIHFPAIDQDVYIPGLLAGMTGSAAWMASQMGVIGGRSRSETKVRSARLNGTKGGRPRKKTTPVRQVITRSTAAKTKAIATTKRAG